MNNPGTFSPQWGGLGDYNPASAEEEFREQLRKYEEQQRMIACLEEQQRQNELLLARKYYIVVTQTGEERYTLMLEQLYNREVIAENLSLEEARELLIARQVADKLQGEQKPQPVTENLMCNVWYRGKGLNKPLW